MSRRVPLLGLTLSLLALIGTAPAAAQSAGDVLNTAMERFEERMSGIDNYTVVQGIMGMEVTNYFEKRMVDGHTVFVLQDSEGESQDEDISTFYGAFMQVADKAEIEGTETVDGYRCHVIRVDDFSDITFDPAAEEGEEQDFEPKSGKFYLDTDEYLIRKMYIEGEYSDDGEVRPVTMDVALQDYREVDGMVHPFRTVMTISGMTADVSDEELEEARESLEELRKQMDEMPESQRKMMESMMKGQLEQLEQMVNSGSMKIETEVKELRVNTGPPEGAN